MSELCRLILCGLIRFFRSRASLEAEILVLRHQLNILRRESTQAADFRRHQSADICRTVWLGAERSLGQKSKRTSNVCKAICAALNIGPFFQWSSFSRYDGFVLRPGFGFTYPF